jgi:site-specific recombinase XerD
LSKINILQSSNIDLSSGLVRVEKGKGGKARSVVIGIKTRRALLAYRREIKPGRMTLYSNRQEAAEGYQQEGCGQ